MSSGSMMSNVGNSQVYNDADQRTYKHGEDPNQPQRFEAGQDNSHKLLDSKDQRSLGNTLDAAQKAEEEEERRDQEDITQDPQDRARRHGNEPSRGARIDAELQAEDEQTLRKKDDA